MSEVRREVLDYIERLSDTKLEALKPILRLLTKDSPAVETDLTEEEKAVIHAGREEYRAGKYVPLSSI